MSAHHDRSVYKRNITDTKYKKKYHNHNSIDVLVPNIFHDKQCCTTTSSYERDDELYSDEELFVVVVDGIGDDEEDYEEGRSAAWRFFEKYLKRSEPLKVMHWTLLRQGGDTAGSYLNRRNDLVDSFDSLVETLPKESLDALVTVQAKPRIAPCKLCQVDYDSNVTDGERMRHNLHITDSMLTVAPACIGDENNLFLGQEDQVTTEQTLREVLIDRTYVQRTNATTKVCAAQVNIYSKEGSNMTATVNKRGRIVFEEEGENTAPLAALLPWIRLPSYLLSTEDDDRAIDIQEINLWMCPEECRTNTHYDGHHNILMVLHGSKTVELSPPGTVRGSPVHSNHANHPFMLRCTQVGGHLVNENFGFDTGPLGAFKDSSKNNIVVSVGAGEAIFIPEGWWHRVESSDDCVAINVWFDHDKSSLSSIAHNPHQLPYQAREMVRRYIDANIEDVNKDRQSFLFIEMLGQLGFELVGWTPRWKVEPGQPIRQLFNKMELGRIVPEERENEEIVRGMQIIERYASQLLGVADSDDGIKDPGSVQPLRHLALPLAAKSLGNMISLFITRLDPEKQRDRIAMMSLFKRFPAVSTNHQRQIFTSLVKSISQGACYTLSVAWEKHGSTSEAEDSFSSLFGRCIGDEGRKYFMKEVDEFRNESARRLILGDLMLINPSDDEE
ncbi:hypothetical protein ACHAXR_010416 [Thalassiosira sp. AJA248-18]